MKRLVSILMSLVLLMTMAGIDSGARAVAEDVRAAAASGDEFTAAQTAGDQSDKKESGQWRYFVNSSGYVTISGYGDPTVKTLSVPDTLDGVPVSAIAQGAFAGMTALSALTVPTTVTHMDENVFDASANVAVRSYHGSYALKYARSHGMRVIDRSSFSFKDGVVDLTPVARHISGGGGTVTMRGIDAAALEVGGCFFIPGRDKLGMNVIVGVVNGISNRGDTAEVAYSEGNIFSAVTDLNISSDSDSVRAEVSSIGDGVTYDGEIGAALDLLSVNKTAQKSFSTDAFKFNWTSGGFSASGYVNFKIDFSLAANIEAGISWFTPYVDINKFDIGLCLTPTYHVELNGKYSLPASRQKLGTVTIYNVGVFSVKADLFLNIDAQGSINFTLQQEYKAELKWNNSRSRFDPSMQSRTISQELSVEANLDVKLIPKVYASLVGVKVLELSMTLHLDFDAKLVVRTPVPLHTCADISLILHISFNIKFGVLSKVAGFTKTLFDKTLKLNDISLIRAQHYEDWAKVGKCTRGSKTVTFDTQGGNAISPITTAWGTCITVSSPARQGRIFAGWYTDSGYKTEWSMRTPVTADITLYAKWKTLPTNPPVVTPKPTGKPPVVTPTPTPPLVVTPEPVVTPTPTPTPTPPPVVATSITLDKASAELYAHEGAHTTQLSATLLPPDAEDKTLFWSSSDPSVAYVSQTGLVTAYKAGKAVITCQPYSNMSLSASCEITVKQRVESIDLSAYKLELVRGDAQGLQAAVLPSDATNKTVVWRSDDESVATVDQNGLVRAIGHGSTVITATAQDGYGAEQKCDVTVENELEIDAAVRNDVFFSMGQLGTRIGYANATPNSLLRMQTLGKPLVWSITRTGDNVSDVSLTTYDMQTAVKGSAAAGKAIMLDLVGMRGTGTDQYTVTCEAGEYSASASFTVTILSDEYTDKVTLPATSINIRLGATAQIPVVPTSAVTGKLVPEGLSCTIAGDKLFEKFATQTMAGDRININFTQSGLYTAVAAYARSNLRYEVPVTFIVEDEQGFVHLPVTDVALPDARYSLVAGEELALSAAVLPKDAWNKALKWSVKDTAVATVNEQGVLTGVAPGSTYVTAEAADGSETQDGAFVTVESMLQLTDRSIDVTVYEDGQTGVAVDGVSLTDASVQRLLARELAASWTLERVSGDSSEVGIEEVAASAQGATVVSGVRLNLLRMNHPGTDVYRLICKSGTQESSCMVSLHVQPKELLPLSVTLATSSYTVPYGENLTLDITPVCMPALPEGYQVAVEAPQGFWNAVTVEDRGESSIVYSFAGCGLYDVNVVYSIGNASFSVPVSVCLLNEQGSAPVMVDSISVDHETASLLTGETLALSAEALPGNADDRGLVWSSFDSSIASVSSTGVVTANAVGRTAIMCTNVASGTVGLCMVSVEDGLTLDAETIELTVYLGGLTRTEIAMTSLTAASSSRLEQAPQWKLERVSGNNLTLRLEAEITQDADGNELYSGAISLYSISATGDTVYRATCLTETESATVNIIVHAVSMDDQAPSAIELSQTEYTADAYELIVFQPTVTCLPGDLKLPDGVRVQLVGDYQFTGALNTPDFFVSQSISTLSFITPGVYQANCVYSWSNVAYTAPVTFRIRDADGNVPVQGRKLAVDKKALWLTATDTAQLNAVFTPADITERGVTWTSSDTSVVQVDQTGLVTAIGIGAAQIVADPADPNLLSVFVPVTVEDAFTVDTGVTEQTLYLQGDQLNSLSSAYLSEGTAQRMESLQIEPQWSLTRLGGTNAELVTTVSEDGRTFSVETSKLLKAGVDTYKLRCEAGSFSWEQTYTLTVQDLGFAAATSVSPKDAQVSLAVGQQAVIDFTPVASPAASMLPQGMEAYYVGIGAFYDALDNDVYSEDGDSVTVAFTKAGRYLLTRQYFLSNLRYTAVCVITVGGAQATELLTVSDAEPIVYMNGWSGTVAVIGFRDGMINELWGDSLKWTLSKSSGDSTLAALNTQGAVAELFIADVMKAGTDRYTVTCEFGGISESVDVTVRAIAPEDGVPQTITLVKDAFEGMIGNTINVPLGVLCKPKNTFLPDTGDEFWHFTLDARGRDASGFSIKNNLLSIEFLYSGYYAGTVSYSSGNLSWELPVYFVIRDEENQIEQPQLSLRVENPTETVYLSGDSGVPVGEVTLSDMHNSRSSNTADAFINACPATWNVEVTSGDAATLSLQATSLSTANLVLTGMSKAGEITYRVTCDAGKQHYECTGTLKVAEAAEQLPDATLTRTTYYAVKGRPVCIDRRLYSRHNGAILKGETHWNPGEIVSAMGYAYDETDEAWIATFYREGRYLSTVTVQTANSVYELPLSIIVSSDESVDKTVLRFPTVLETIDSEAFAGTTAAYVDLRGTQAKTIQSKAFRNCVDMERVYLPDTLTYIADDAFYGCLNLTIYCTSGSYAEAYARRLGVPVICE